mmetsp:Transcript_15211/g.24705  ORF Transcript_15211/g.24705 Transcript_15211/m.24705 type:complete len:201 (+) Transcript_15211:968-1570(+)
MFPPVDNVETRHGHSEVAFIVSSKRCNVLIQWYATRCRTCPSCCHGYRQNCICSKSLFVCGTIQAYHGLIKTLLVFHGHSNEMVPQLVVYIAHSFQHTFTIIPITTVPQFTSFFRPRASSTRHNRSKLPIFRCQVDLNRGVPTAIQNFPRMYTRYSTRMANLLSNQVNRATYQHCVYFLLVVKTHNLISGLISGHLHFNQ